MSVQAVRAPEERLEGLPDYPFESVYREVDGLRLAHLDEGDGKPVVFFHGEPTWSFLWRRVIQAVRDAGYRCIAPDYAGFRRSGKPSDLAWYTYDRPVELMKALLEELYLREATFVLHDWGGPIGLRVAVEQPERVARLVLMDTGLFTGRQPMSPAWQRFAAFVERADELPIGFLVRRGCHVDPGDEVAAAYDAPFPNEVSKEGARAFPAILPLRPEDPGAAEGARVLDALREDRRPLLLLWGAEDRPLPPAAGEAFAQALGRPAPTLVEGAGHYLQEDQGGLVGATIADWLASKP